MKSSPCIHYIDSKNQNAGTLLGLQLRQMLSAYPSSVLPPVILCIGTDRVTGDSLGPMTGTFLQAFTPCPFPLYGTLQFPVHALNLKSALRQIKKKHPRNPVIAVDASFGSKKHLGYITLGNGSLQPGAGVKKNLEEAGNIFITGIISQESTCAQLALQNTRLSCVMPLACCIAQGIACACGALTATMPLCLPMPAEVSLHQYIPDHRPPEHHWQSC